LQQFDYSSEGAYFVTICVHDRESLFGSVENGQVILNDIGSIVKMTWDGLPQQFPHVRLGECVIMPNHIHGIIWFVGVFVETPPVGAQFIAPNERRGPSSHLGAMNLGAMNRAPTLGAVVRSFKAKATWGIRRAGFSYFGWQRNYWEHVVRNDEDMDRIREYIINNPVEWEMDEENPKRCQKLVFPA